MAAGVVAIIVGIFAVAYFTADEGRVGPPQEEKKVERHIDELR